LIDAGTPAFILPQSTEEGDHVASEPGNPKFEKVAERID
jgi:hypothetical protein